MSVMLAECKVWAEEPGVELRVTPHAGVLEVSILKGGEVVATGTVARWGPSCYNASERDSIKRQLQAGNAIIRDAARARGYKLHPLLAKRLAEEPT